MMMMVVVATEKLKQVMHDREEILILTILEIPNEEMG